MHNLPTLPRPLGLPYALIMQGRRALYETGRLPGHAPACLTVSVGNIAMGGTGKTPLVSLLLGLAEEAGQKAVVLTRGYKGKPGPLPLVVTPDTPVAACGDEALMLAREHPLATTIAFARRAASARLAEKEFAPDLLILDDGMQHLAVQRDLNLILLRPRDLDRDWNRVLPAGPWREGESALASASAFLIKTDDADSLLPLARERLQPFGKPVFFFSLVPRGLRPLGTAPGAPCPDSEHWRDQPYILISGVGNPDALEQSAAAFLGRKAVRHFAFADHHAYTARDVQAVLKLSPAPLPLVCTAKDAVKLEAFADILANTPVRVLESAVEFGPTLFSADSFADWWARRPAGTRPGGKA